jgi:hypothetical protein
MGVRFGRKFSQDDVLLRINDWDWLTERFKIAGQGEDVQTPG